jgi:hypothetical protein
MRWRDAGCATLCFARSARQRYGPERERVRRRGRRIAKLDDVVAPGVENVGIVAGLTEHPVAIPAQQTAHFSGGVTVIDAQALLGLLFAERADPVLTLKHAIEILQRHAETCARLLESGSTIDCDQPFPIFGIDAHPVLAALVNRHPVLLLIGAILGGHLFAKRRILRVSLPPPFVTVGRLASRCADRDEPCFARCRNADARRRFRAPSWRRDMWKSHIVLVRMRSRATSPGARRANKKPAPRGTGWGIVQAPGVP